MTETTTGCPWTEEDVDLVADKLQDDSWMDLDEQARSVLATIGPLIERERRAAYERGYEVGYDDALAENHYAVAERREEIVEPPDQLRRIDERGE